ncbi:hypothetical protein DM01DRAFT_1374949 [Hesseltinella vesiculosa]|uniref:C2H2-type domain-containing protein n=1 Tax=Hesseltinella vesiculosa TaxID=101127 RepID=A0A1X2GF01_9FUNG|nr:hypothetical protein DM01DRAFT_1374949 [Hesseltinella vesiculosa]
MKEKPHKRDKCPKAFKRKSDLSKHIEAIHTNTDRLPCPNECARTFKTKKTHYVHMKKACPNAH